MTTGSRRDEGERSLSRRGLPLRWRVTVLSSLAIALLVLIAALTTFVAARDSLERDLLRSVREDARKVAELYGGGESGNVSDTLVGPTGRVIVQLYDPAGLLLTSSLGLDPDETLDPELVRSAVETPREWSGELGGIKRQAALAPFGFGVAVVLADTAYIDRALRQLARTLAISSLVLILVSTVIGYLIAATAIRPITELARLAEALEPSRLAPIPYRGPDDEVGQLSRVLNDLIRRLRESIDAQRSFLAETSHELRTPLTSLRGFLDRAYRRASPEVRRDLTDARRIAQTMSRLVEDLLQLSRGQLIQELVPHLIDPYHDILEPVAEEFDGVRLRGEPGKLLLGDPERLRQLVRNLTANAVRAAADPADVTLTLGVDGDAITLTVRDSGPGIPDEVLPRIFDKFYKGAGGGSGLGLAIAQQIAEAHGGSISVRSTPGDTVFRVVLPAIDDPDA